MSFRRNNNHYADLFDSEPRIVSGGTGTGMDMGLGLDNGMVHLQPPLPLEEDDDPAFAIGSGSGPLDCFDATIDDMLRSSNANANANANDPAADDDIDRLFDAEAAAALFPIESCGNDNSNINSNVEPRFLPTATATATATGTSNNFDCAAFPEIDMGGLELEHQAGPTPTPTPQQWYECVRSNAASANGHRGGDLPLASVPFEQQQQQQEQQQQQSMGNGIGSIDKDKDKDKDKPRAIIRVPVPTNFDNNPAPVHPPYAAPYDHETYQDQQLQLQSQSQALRRSSEGDVDSILSWLDCNGLGPPGTAAVLGEVTETAARFGAPRPKSAGSAIRRRRGAGKKKKKPSNNRKKNKLLPRRRKSTNDLAYEITSSSSGGAGAGSEFHQLQQQQQQQQHHRANEANADAGYRRLKQRRVSPDSATMTSDQPFDNNADINNVGNGLGHHFNSSPSLIELLGGESHHQNNSGLRYHEALMKLAHSMKCTEYSRRQLAMHRTASSSVSAAAAAHRRQCHDFNAALQLQPPEAMAESWQHHQPQQHRPDRPCRRHSLQTALHSPASLQLQQGVLWGGGGRGHQHPQPHPHPQHHASSSQTASLSSSISRCMSYDSLASGMTMLTTTTTTTSASSSEEMEKLSNAAAFLSGSRTTLTSGLEQSRQRIRMYVDQMTTTSGGGNPGSS